MERTDLNVRTGAGLALSLSCGLLVVAIATSGTASEAGVVFLFGTAFPYLLATGGVVAGIAVAVSDLRSAQVLVLIGWTVAGVAFASATAALTIAFELSLGVRMARATSVILNNVAGGLVVGLVVGGFHVQSRRRAAIIERQRDELELLNRIVSHDIRNDLNVALGMSELLESRATNGNERTHRRLRNSLANAVQLTENVEDTIEILDQSSEGLSRERIAVGPLVEEQVESVRASYPAAAVRVGDLPAALVLGHEMLPAVIRNLLTNAIQHNQSDDVVVHVDLEATDDAVLVSVADNGPGIPEDLREKLFDTDRLSLDGGDAGIGLYLVSTIVRASGGDVRVADSDLGGARITVRLRRAGSASRT